MIFIDMTSSLVASQGEPPTDGEEDEQSEVLFRAFVKVKAEKEQQTDIKEAVEGEEDVQDSGDRNVEIGQKLAMIADELDEEYGSEIDSMIDQLQLTSESAYFSFHEMAMRLLRRGVTWGNIVALFLFGYRVIVRFFTKNIPDLIRRMTGMIGRLCAEKVTQWVKENGGWIRVLTNVDRKKWVRYIGGAALGILGVAILVSLWKK